MFFYLGVFSVFSFAPFHCFPIVLISIAYVFSSINENIKPKKAFVIGWEYGFGYNLSCLYWIYHPLTIDYPRFMWLIPFALILIPSFLAIYQGLACFAFSLIKHKKILRVLCFATCWTLAEILMGCNGVLDFPWTLVGYIWTVTLQTSQLASIAGAYGLSFFTILCSGLLGLSWEYKNNLKKSLSYAAISVGLIITSATYGQLKLINNPIKKTNVRVRLVQGNIPQELKWADNYREKNLQKYIALSQSSADIIIWPEAAVPYHFNDSPDLPRILSAALTMNHSILLTGGIKRTLNNDAYNSLFVINYYGDIVSRYDKMKLLPFGEYVPFRKLIPIQKIATVLGIRDIIPGVVNNIAKISDSEEIKPLICSEAMFPGAALINDNKTKWVLNITNDAWFGITVEPFQHYEICRIRAIESGLSFVRVANTGISGIFDGLGRDIGKISAYTTGVFEDFIPSSINYTIYGQLSNLFLFEILILLLTILILSSSKFFRKRN